MSNTGYAGIAISVPLLMKETFPHFEDTSRPGDSDQLRETLARLTVGLVQTVHELGKGLRYDKDSFGLYNPVTNHKSYTKTVTGALDIIRNTVMELYDYTHIIGDDALLLLENIWLYTHMVSDEKPDETAMLVTDTCDTFVREQTESFK